MKNLKSMQNDSHTNRESKKTAHGRGPPNGGIVAWLQILWGFCIFLTTWYIMSRESVSTYTELT